MDMEHQDFAIGDRVYCDKRNKYGFVCRLNPLGCQKKIGIGVHWDDNNREVIFGHDLCCKLLIKNQ